MWENRGIKLADLQENFILLLELRQETSKNKSEFSKLAIYVVPAEILDW